MLSNAFVFVVSSVALAENILILVASAVILAANALLLLVHAGALNVGLVALVNVMFIVECCCSFVLLLADFVLLVVDATSAADSSCECRCFSCG